MKRLSGGIGAVLLGLSVNSCQTTAETTAPAVAKPSATAVPAVTTAPRGTCRVYLDGLIIINGLNPLAGYSEAEKKFTFFSTMYAPDVIKNFSYATFSISQITNNEIKEGVDISNDPNIIITALVSQSPKESASKSETTFTLSNGSQKNLKIQKVTTTLKGTLSFEAPAVSAIKEFGTHVLRIEFEFPYVNGKLKTFDDANPVEIKEGIGFYRN